MQYSNFRIIYEVTSRGLDLVEKIWKRRGAVTNLVKDIKLYSDRKYLRRRHRRNQVRKFLLTFSKASKK